MFQKRAESDTGWLFPVGDEVHALGYPDMFTDMLDSLEQNRKPQRDILRWLCC